MSSTEKIQLVHDLLVGSLRFVKIIGLIAFGYWGIDYLENKLKRAIDHIYPDELRLTLIGVLFSYTARFVVCAAILYECGVNASALLGVFGVVGIAVGYAAKTGVANVISGFFLMLEKPFALGDTLLIDDQEGVVTAVNLFAVTVRMPDRIVRLPHDQLLKYTIIKMRK
jgi:small conductance mechanosensitive channel